MEPKQGLLKRTGKALKKASPTILSILGTVGVVATAILAVKATPKSLERIEDVKRDKQPENGKKLAHMETIAACWQCYIPAAATGIATIGCILGANILNRHQQASLVSAYALVNRSFRDYKNKVKELCGQETYDKITESLMVERAEAPTISGSFSGKGFDFGETDDQKHLFYDAFSKRYFEATFSDVLLAELHVNRNFAINGGEIMVDEFYKFLGLDTPNELKGLSWFVSDFYYFIDFSHSKHCVDDGPDREPVECWMIEMEYPPTSEPLECCD